MNQPSHSANPFVLPCLTGAGLNARHGFFTRAGGVSRGDYASLNGSLSGGDARAAVLENRHRVANALDLAPEWLLGITQVHGVLVAMATREWAPGAGPRADAMVTNRPGTGLVIVTADCAPVLLADVGAGVIGAAHAGWRGATNGILEATVEAMEELGARAIRAVIGPCIGQESYQVGPDLRDAVLTRHPERRALFLSDGPAHWRFDLAGLCAARLAGLGIEAERIEADTCADPERFFSHRRRTLAKLGAGGGKIGHQMSAIRL